MSCTGGVMALSDWIIVLISGSRPSEEGMDMVQDVHGPIVTGVLGGD